MEAGDLFLNVLRGETDMNQVSCLLSQFLGNDGFWVSSMYNSFILTDHNGGSLGMGTI